MRLRQELLSKKACRNTISLLVFSNLPSVLRSFCVKIIGSCPVKHSPFTMAEDTAFEPSFFDYALDDPSGLEYQFDAPDWVDPPMLVFDDDDPDSKEIVSRRNANDSVYQWHFASFKSWQRYATLGYYTLDDGSLFDMAWTCMDTCPLRLHRMIWYNYMYHIDRHLDLPPNWMFGLSTSLSHIFRQLIQMLFSWIQLFYRGKS